MRIPVEVSRNTPVLTLEELAHTWRGHCLDLYSTGERAVSDCLEVVRDASLDLSKESSHPGHKARARSLAEVLGQVRFRGHSKKALEYLAAWQSLYEERVWLAHGSMRVSADQVSFVYCDYSGGSLALSNPRAFTPREMKALLGQLRLALERMDKQFGQIEAACKRGDF